jgi:hypothetical protein
MLPSGLFHCQNRLGVGCGFDLTLHNDSNRRDRSTSMWSFNDGYQNKDILFIAC